jgi:hypothetical protein
VSARPDPWSLFLAELGDQHFPAIREAIGPAAGRDAFLLSIPALELLEQLRPDDGSGEAIDDLVDLAWAAWRFWDAGRLLLPFDAAATRALVAGSAVDPRARAPARGAWYIQVAERIIWGRPAAEGAFEPLDGCFLVRDEEQLLVVACFGVHPDRPGFTIATARGGRPGRLARSDGTALFAPVMPGGAEAGLHAVTSPDELLLLGWHALMAREQA